MLEVLSAVVMSTISVIFASGIVLALFIGFVVLVAGSLFILVVNRFVPIPEDDL
jgi:hypothetical protein